ncbi:MAG: ATP-binding protein [Cytophagaceae bacterium]
MKLKTEILLFFVIISLAIGTIGGGFYYYYFKSVFLDNTRNHLASLTIAKENRLKDILQKRKDEIKLISSSPYLQNTLQKFLTTNDASIKDEITRTLYYTKTGFAGLGNFYLLDTAGTIIASTDPFSSEKEFKNKVSFIHALDGERCLHDLYLTENFKLKNLLSAPVFVNNEIVAGLLVEYDASDIMGLCTDYAGLNRTGETIIFKEKNDSIVFISNTRFVFKRPLKFAVPISDSLSGKFLALKKGYSDNFIDYRGVKTFAAISPIDETSWIIMTKIDAKEALEPVEKLKRIVIIISISIVLILLGFLYLITERYIQPVKLITDAAEKISNGDLSQRVQVSQNNEFGKLADSFNSMTDNLVQSQSILKEKVEQLDNSNEALNRFAAVVSHDLKAPLNRLSGLIRLMKMESGNTLDTRKEELFQMMQQQISVMKDLITGILQSARNGGKDFLKEKVRVSDIIDEVTSNLLIPENFKINKEENLPVLKFQKVSLLQVFQNLIGNAIKYNDKDCGIVRIGIFNEPGYVGIFVKDNGKGISSDHMDQVFNSYNSISEKTNILESTGLGLSIVKKIIDENGGRIWVESDPAIGTTFYFTFPEAVVIKE